VVRLLSAFHLYNLEKWEICGCPECLAASGLQIKWVEDKAQRRNFRVLVPLQLDLPGCSVSASCSDSPNLKSD
jgi:hypothetical protein